MPKKPALPRPLILVLLLLIIPLYVFFVTYGTGDFFGKEFHSETFDSLGKALVQGRANLPDSYEAYVIDGKNYLYFGPFPAMLRILPNWVLPNRFGCWARLSLFFASLLTWLAFCALMRKNLERNKRLSVGQKRLLFFSFSAAFALGSPLLFLISCSYIFHEALAWGLAGATWGIYFVSEASEHEAVPDNALLGLSVCAMVALLSRVTMGLPIYVVLAFFALCTLRRQNWEKNAVRKTILLLSPAITGVGIQAWYNWARFGSIATFVDYKYYHLDYIYKLGPFRPARIPVALVNYFGMRAGYFSSHFPFFQLQVHYNPWPTLFSNAYREWTISLSLASCWLVLGAALGARKLVSNPDRWKTVVAGAFLWEMLFVMSFCWITQRYSADLVPLLVFLFWIFASGLDGKKSTANRNFALVSLLCLVSVLVTVSSTVHWSAKFNWAAPREYRDSLKKLGIGKT